MRTTSRTKSHIIVEADEAVSGISVPLVAGGSDEVNVACSPSMSDKSSPSSSAEAVQSECSISTFDKTSPNRARIARTTPSMKGTPKKSARKRKGQLAAGESPSKKKGGMDLNSLFEDLEEEAKKVMVLDTIAEVWEYLEDENERDGNIGVQLQVAHLDLPAWKAGTKNIAHVYLCDPTAQKEPAVLQKFSNKIRQYLLDKNFPPTLKAALVRATIWDTTVPKCKKQFNIGDVVEISKISGMNTFNGVVQFNCSPQNITKMSG